MLTAGPVVVRCGIAWIATYVRAVEFVEMNTVPHTSCTVQGHASNVRARTVVGCLATLYSAVPGVGQCSIVAGTVRRLPGDHTRIPVAALCLVAQ